MLDLFLKTEIGFAIRATGDNEQMIRSCGVNTDGMKLVGLGLANCLVALSGALVAQYQGFADVGMGVGTVVAGLASVIAGRLWCAFMAWLGDYGVIVGSLIYRVAIFAALRLGWLLDLKLITAVLVVLALSGPVWSSSLAKFGRKRRATNIPAA